MCSFMNYREIEIYFEEDFIKMRTYIKLWR